MSDEIIYFPDDDGWDNSEIDWVKEFEEVTATKPKSKPKVKKKPRNDWVAPKKFTMLGMSAEETETTVTVIFGMLFVSTFVGSLIGYMTWYFKQ